MQVPVIPNPNKSTLTKQQFRCIRDSLLLDLLRNRIITNMGRKSKQPGGHKPLTHHERTKKFASSEYGTVSRRLAGHSQYQLGDCALSVTSLLDGGTTSSDTATTATISTALCSPSGYLYQEAAIVEYLLIRTQDLNRQRSEWQAQQLH